MRERGAYLVPEARSSKKVKQSFTFTFYIKYRNTRAEYRSKLNFKIFVFLYNLKFSTTNITVSHESNVPFQKKYNFCFCNVNNDLTIQNIILTS